MPPKEEASLLDVFATVHRHHFTSFANQSREYVWAHAALLYLSILVSGWQLASSDEQFYAVGSLGY